MRHAALAAAVLGLAAGCAADLDLDRARVCRAVLPALHPEGSLVEILGEQASAGGRTVTIAYRLRAPDAVPRSARTACTFAGEDLAPGRLDLVGVETDGATLSDLQLHVLRRWWLGAEDVAEAAAEPPSQPLVTTPITKATAYALQQALNAAPIAGVYALLAVAYTLVYGLIGRIFLAFGEIAVLGGFATVIGAALAAAAGAPALTLALPLGIALALTLPALAAGVAGTGLVAPLAARPGPALLVATVGLAIAIQEFLRLTQGAADRWLPPTSGSPVALVAAPGFLVTVTPLQLGVTAAAFGLAGGTALMMRRFRFGRAWRACADDARAAALVGVDPARVLVLTLALCGMLCGAAGAILVAHYGGIGFSGGAILGLKALVAAILGGIGSLPGALLGGVLVGLIETFWSAYLPVAYRDVALFAILSAVLALRPGGLFGFGALAPRPV